jgi:hypothetical protein
MGAAFGNSWPVRVYEAAPDRTGRQALSVCFLAHFVQLPPAVFASAPGASPGDGNSVTTTAASTKEGCAKLLSRELECMNHAC